MAASWAPGDQDLLCTDITLPAVKSRQLTTRCIFLRCPGKLVHESKDIAQCTMNTFKRHNDLSSLRDEVH